MKPNPSLLITCGLLLGGFSWVHAASSGEPVYPVTKAPPPAPLPAVAQPETWQSSAAPASPPAQSAGTSASELETLVRPIALHPDPLLAVILPASAYPLEIAQAARFVKDTNNLARLADQPWDDKVKAVAQYPEVIAMMDADIAWTTKLGEAFVSQPMDLMNAIQALRGKAQTNGALKSGPQQVVSSTNAVVERMYEGKIVYVTNTIVEVQPASTNVVYVPTYNPQTVYVEDDNDGVEAVVGFGVALGMTAIIANNCDWYYGGCYWGHYPPPPPYYPPPYYPPPGTRPPTGGRPPGERPDRPGDRPGDRPSAGTQPSQRWQPDQNRLSKAGAPATAQSREARGWGGTSASTQPAQGNVASGAGRQPSAWQPSAGTRPTASPGTARTDGPWSSSRPSGAGNASRVGDRSASPSLDRGGVRNTSAFNGVGSGGGARDFSSRGATSRAGGGARGGARGR